MVIPSSPASSSLAVALLGALVSCGGDPILKQARKESLEKGTVEANPSANTPGTPHPMNPPGTEAESPTLAPAGDVEGLPGIPEAPPPGDPSVPPPGGIDIGHAPGHTVNLSGEVVFPGYRSGPIRIDVFDGDQRDLSARPRVVGVAQIAGPGMFTVSVPEAARLVWISSFNDENSNSRPDLQSDPTGYYEKNPVRIDKGPVADLTIRLERPSAPAESPSK